MVERNVKATAYLSLDEKSLKETKKEAKEEAIAAMGEEDAKDSLEYPNIIWDVDELYLDGGELCLNGGFSSGGKELGSLSQTIPLGNETIINIIDYYMEKMEKVRAVLEATK